MGTLTHDFIELAYELNKIYDKIDTTKYPELKELFTAIYNIYYLSIDGVGY